MLQNAVGYDIIRVGLKGGVLIMKKRAVSVLSAMLLLFSSAYAFEFPTPDWGALLREKEGMVGQTELELYAEGAADGAPYFGARLEPGAGAYLGMIAETSESFQPLGSYLTYINDMWQDDLYYPANEMIRNGNAVTMVGWTINDMGSVNYEKVRSVLNTLAAYNKPMFIRFANEMNVSALGNDPSKYIEVFRTVADMVHEYPNFAVVWSPNDLGGLDRPFEYFYPGNEYVDWIGVSCYSIKYFQGNPDTDYKSSVYFMTGDYAWTTNRLKPIMSFMEKNSISKPVMISEGGAATGNSYGENLEEWAAPRLRNMLWYAVMKYPQIKMVNYFNVIRADETERFNISEYPYAAEIFREAAASGAYIRGIGEKAEFVFRKAEESGTLAAKNGTVRLYSLTYIPGNPNPTVSYSIDGVWYHASGQIPYVCNLGIQSLSDGAHSLKIQTGGAEKSYTFYKTGQYIRFGAQPEIPTPVIRVTLDGQEIGFDQPPVIVRDRTLVPLRAIFEAMGAVVSWDDTTETVTAVRGNTKISLQIGSDKLFVNGSERVLDVPAQLMGGRTLVPARAVAEGLGADVGWNDETQTVIITQ